MQELYSGNMSNNAMSRRIGLGLVYALSLLTLIFVLTSSVSAAGRPDCVSCHNVSSATNAIDVAKINASSSSIHKDLNNGATNTTVLSDLVDKACWACHGNGTEPAVHPSNYNSPLNCTDCHGVGTGNYSATIIFEHNNESGDVRTSANCQDCHNNSVATSLDPVIPNTRANVSHYGTNTSLNPGGGNTTNCASCHKNTSIAQQWLIKPNTWGSYTVRHPAAGSSSATCAYCHNSSGVTSFHDAALYKYPYPDIHYSFDWEADDNNESGLTGQWESCPACHSGGFYTTRICEDCHVINSTLGTPNGPYSEGLDLRSDILSIIPKVYNHINASSYYSGILLGIANMSGRVGGDRASSCYDYNTGDGRGVCHGVGYHNRSTAANYYGHSEGEPVSGGNASPYMWNNPIDTLPNTSACLVCHNMTGSVNQTSWGNPPQVNASNMYGATENADCYFCHTTDKTQPKYFHDQTVKMVDTLDDCIGCHDTGNKFVPNAGMNVGQFNRSDVDVGQNIGKKSENRTLHGDINNDGVTNNSDCQVCHYNFSDMGYGYSVKLLVSDTAENAGNASMYNTYYCSVCHFANRSYNRATGVASIPPNYPYNITEVGDAPKISMHTPYDGARSYSDLGIFQDPNGYDISSFPTLFEGGRTPACEVCHNNSLVYYDPSDSVLKRAVHYGKYTNLTTIGVSDQNTTSCVQCHRGEDAPGGTGVTTTQAERLSWGIDDNLGRDGGYVSSNRGNDATGFDMFGTSTPSERYYCYTCHILRNVQKTKVQSIDPLQSNFHSAEVTKFMWNCYTCH